MPWRMSFLRRGVLVLARLKTIGHFGRQDLVVFDSAGSKGVAVSIKLGGEGLIRWYVLLVKIQN